MKTAKIKLIICMVLLVCLISLVSAATKYINTLDGSNQSIGNNNLIFIDNSNSLVGIGTISPSNKLDVAGTVNATRFTINGSDLYAVFAELTDKIGNTTEEIWSVIDNETFARLTGFSGENITSGSVADARVADDLTIASTKTINTTGGLNVSGGAYIGGNVGIGTSSPQTELHVIGSANITGTVYAHNFSGNSNISFLNASGDEIVRFTDDGMVGIGTLTPNEKLTVVGNVNITQNLTISGRITGSHKQELEVESIGDVEAGKGMVLLMHFNNDSSVGENYNTSNGSIIYDYTGFGNNGTLYGNTSGVGVVYNPDGGMFGGAYEFDGMDDYVNIGDDASLNPATITYMAWVKMNSWGASKSVISKRDVSNVGGYTIQLGSTANTIGGHVYVDGGWRGDYAGTIIPGKWTHVAMTYDGTDRDLYINGKKISTVTYVGSINDDSGDLNIGSEEEQSQYFNGTIDEVAIYNRSLSAEEILENYKKGFKNVIEGSTVFSDETRVKDNLIVQGNLSGDGDLIINPGGGNVGIGTSSPGTILHVSQVDQVDLVRIRMDSGTGKNTYLDFYEDGAQHWTILNENTGDQLRFRNNTNANVLVLDQNGNVGIGTTGPSGKLDISDVTNPTIYVRDSSESGVIGFFQAFGTDDLRIGTASNNGISLWVNSATEAVTIQSGGNVGIGETNPGFKLEVTANTAGTYAARIANAGDNSDRQGLSIRAGANDNSGTNVHIDFHDGDLSHVGRISSSGGVTTYGQASDIRLKKDFGTFNGLDMIMAIEPLTFRWKESTGFSNDIHYGMIAQNLYEIFPDAVSKGDDGEDPDNIQQPWNVDYGRITPLLIEGIKEQQTQIQELKSQNQQKTTEIKQLTQIICLDHPDEAICQ